MHRGVGTVLGLLLLPLMVGCATSRYGHFAAQVPERDLSLATDALLELQALYPPARTRFALEQPAGDAFGSALVEGLRRAGYAVLETPGPDHAPQAVALRYVLDEAEGLCRLTLVLGPQTLSRPYSAAEGTPVGSWMWRRS